MGRKEDHPVGVVQVLMEISSSIVGLK